MKNHELLAEVITEKDEEALTYLIDVQCHNDESEEDRVGFRLEFYFRPNPFFTNTQLTKR